MTKILDPEGIEKVGTEDPDLILVDVMMPGMDGWETSRLIKQDEASKNKMIVMFTTKAEDVERIKSQTSVIADWYINKPIERETFVKTVKWLLTKPFKKILEISIACCGNDLPHVVDNGCCGSLNICAGPNGRISPAPLFFCG